MRYKLGIASMLSLTIFLCCGWTAPDGCASNDPPPSHTGAIVGVVGVAAAITVGTIVLVHVHHSHHRIKGCAVTSAQGMEVLEGDNETPYLLTGIITGIKPGERVYLEGDKHKAPDASHNPSTFAVEKMHKDYGPCPNMPVMVPLPKTPADPPVSETLAPPDQTAAAVPSASPADPAISETPAADLDPAASSPNQIPSPSKE